MVLVLGEHSLCCGEHTVLVSHHYLIIRVAKGRTHIPQTCSQIIYPEGRVKVKLDSDR